MREWGRDARRRLSGVTAAVASAGAADASTPRPLPPAVLLPRPAGAAARAGPAAPAPPWRAGGRRPLFDPGGGTAPRPPSAVRLAPRLPPVEWDLPPYSRSQSADAPAPRKGPVINRAPSRASRSSLANEGFFGGRPRRPLKFTATGLPPTVRPFAAESPAVEESTRRRGGVGPCLAEEENVRGAARRGPTASEDVRDGWRRGGSDGC
jgi:hypothetical protein